MTCKVSQVRVPQRAPHLKKATLGWPFCFLMQDKAVSYYLYCCYLTSQCLTISSGRATPRSLAIKRRKVIQIRFCIDKFVKTCELEVLGHSGLPCEIIYSTLSCPTSIVRRYCLGFASSIFVSF